MAGLLNPVGELACRGCLQSIPAPGFSRIVWGRPCGCGVTDQVRRIRKIFCARAAGSGVQERPNCGEGLLLAPGAERIGLGLFPFLLQFVEADSQIAEAGQRGSALTTGGPTSVFSESDIPAVVSAVFAPRPVTLKTGVEMTNPA